jgi:hypothetical protein
VKSIVCVFVESIEENAMKIKGRKNVFVSIPVYLGMIGLALALAFSEIGIISAKACGNSTIVTVTCLFY